MRSIKTRLRSTQETTTRDFLQEPLLRIAIWILSRDKFRMVSSLVTIVFENLITVPYIMVVQPLEIFLGY